LVLPLKVIVFDLDGTLIDSAIPFREMKRKIITFLHAKGVKEGLLSDEMLSTEIIDLAADSLRQRGLSEAQLHKIFAHVEGIMNEVEIQSARNAALIDGVPQMLRTLKKRGLKLGVMTRGCRQYTHSVLSKFGLEPFFEAVVARDDVDKPKPDPEHAFHLLKMLEVKAEETLFVGDHWSDAECAKQAGMRFVLVSHGQDTKRVRELGYPIVENVNDVAEFLT
jgi:HAD superfamily hydrolase (TIGR01549 family)